MDLIKAAALVLTSKKAIFYPDSGSPLSGRYCWRDGEQVIYLRYEGTQDKLIDFELIPVEQFRKPPFFELMQKHIISCKKLPDMLIDRIKQLILDLKESFLQLKENNQIIGVNRQEYLIYHDMLGFARLYYDAGWRISLDYTSTKKSFIQKLWKEPGVHAQLISQEISYLIHDQMEKLQKHISMIQYGGYALFLEKEVLVFTQEQFFLVQRGYWDGLTQKQEDLEAYGKKIEPEVLFEYLLQEQHKKPIQLKPSEGLKKLSKAYQDIFS